MFNRSKNKVETQATNYINEVFDQSTKDVFVKELTSELNAIDQKLVTSKNRTLELIQNELVSHGLDMIVELTSKKEYDVDNEIDRRLIKILSTNLNHINKRSIDDDLISSLGDLVGYMVPVHQKIYSTNDTPIDISMYLPKRHLVSN